MKVAIVGAGFTPVEADQLRRAMATFKLTGGVSHFYDKLVGGMVTRGYPKDVDERIFIPGVLLLAGMAIYIWFVKKEIERILGSRYPEVLAVEGLILSAALFLVIFATIYLAIDGLNPGSFTEPLSHLSSHYLTLTILSTVGFGDITAVTDQARLAVMIQMALTLGFLAVTIRVFAWATKRALAQRHGSDASTQHN